MHTVSRMFAWTRPRLPLAAAALSVACSTPADEPASPRPAASEGRYGLLVMTHDRGEPGVAVSGQFAVWAGQRRAAVLHALALPEMAWLVAGTPAVGRCRAVTAPRTAVSDGTDAHIDLLGAGEMTIAPPEGERALRLSPREFPRVLFSLGGVVYDADAPEDLPYRAGGTYRVTAPGDEVGALHGQIAAPEEVELTRHEATADGLEVAWTGEGEAVLTLSRETAGETRGLQCRAAAGGRMRVPAELVSDFGPGEAQLTVGRIARRRVPVAGLSAVDLFFVSRDQAVVRLPAGPALE